MTDNPVQLLACFAGGSYHNGGSKLATGSAGTVTQLCSPTTCDRATFFVPPACGFRREHGERHMVKSRGDEVRCMGIISGLEIKILGPARSGRIRRSKARHNRLGGLRSSGKASGHSQQRFPDAEALKCQYSG